MSITQENIGVAPIVQASILPQGQDAEVFGGLWIDANDAEPKVLAKILATPSNLKQNLREYVERGYTIFKGVVSPDLVDRIVADTQAVRTHGERYVVKKGGKYKEWAEGCDGNEQHQQSQATTCSRESAWPRGRAFFTVQGRCTDLACRPCARWRADHQARPDTPRFGHTFLPAVGETPLSLDIRRHLHRVAVRTKQPVHIQALRP